MNSYAMAFGILGGGLVLAAILWCIPHLRRRRAVGRFRRELTHLDVVALTWRQSLVEAEPSDDVPTPIPEPRPHRRNRHGEQGDGGPALV